MTKSSIIVLFCAQICLSQTFAQNTVEFYSLGAGIDIAYRVPYANNSWSPGVAADLRLSVSGRMKQWEPEVYFRRNVYNMTDKIEYHDGKAIELGVNGNYHLKGERHVFLLGGGINRVSYQQYDYNIVDGWSESSIRGNADRIVVQAAYKFNLKRQGTFIPGLSIGYHNIRKLQVGLTFNFKILRK